MKKVLIIAAMVSGLFSCNKILETSPVDFLAPETYYNDSAQMKNALTAVYDALQKGNMLTGGDGLLTVFNVSDEMFFGSNGTGPKIYNFTAGDQFVYNTWSACYIGIQRANLLLANINKPEMSEEGRNIIKGEAKFLRAFFYFVLVQNFGAVPFRDQPTPTVTDVNLPRRAASEVYDFIIKEMEEAEALVAPISAYNHAGRISKSAVEGMLARVCLYKAGFPNNDASQYANALKWSKKVMESGLHELNKSYSQVFINPTQNLYDTKESIWEIEFWTTGVGDAYTEYGASLGVSLGVTQSNASYPRSAGSYRTHAGLYNLYEKDPNMIDPLIPDLSVDLRRDWNIAPYFYTGNSAPNKTYYKVNQLYERQPNKFDRMYELTEKKFQSNTGTNTLMLRYSDVLLMAAEAENEVNGPTQFAIDQVNAVRRRGYGKLLNGEGVKMITVTDGGLGYTIAPTVTITGGGGSDATATAFVSDGKVSGIMMTNHGRFFTGQPTVTLTGGDGSGAQATATITILTEADLTPEQYASKEVFRQTIQNERARELCFEGWRRLDLIRWGILLPTLQGAAAEANLNAPANYKPYAMIAGNNVSELHYYFPIPLAEMSLNKALTQNPGW